MLLKCVRKMILLLAAIISIGMILYPAISNWLYEKHHSSAFSEWRSSQEEKNQYEEELDNCRRYNDMIYLLQRTSMYQESDIDSFYESCMQTNDGIMAYLEIPSIGALLPVFHGTGGKTLERGIGHVMESSLPIGGSGTHAVLTGHTGMSAAQMFSDLSELKKGDTFVIHTPYNVSLTYVVDQISVVLPLEIERLSIVPEKDYVTLVTCTPFGINTHRLLVRGVRCSDDEITIQTADKERKPLLHYSAWKKHYINAVLAGLTLSFFLIGCVKMPSIRKKSVYSGQINKIL